MNQPTEYQFDMKSSSCPTSQSHNWIPFDDNQCLFKVTPLYTIWSSYPMCVQSHTTKHQFDIIQPISKNTPLNTIFIQYPGPVQYQTIAYILTSIYSACPKSHQWIPLWKYSARIQSDNPRNHFNIVSNVKPLVSVLMIYGYPVLV